MKPQSQQLEELLWSRYERSSSASAVEGVTAVELSDGLAVDTGPETLVRQEFRDDVDVNTILRRFGGSIVAAFGNPKAMYGDFTGIHDYDSAVEKVAEVEKRFMTLDPVLRERFQNNPGKLMEAVDKMTEDEFAEFVKVAAPADTPSPTPVVE